MPESPSHVGAFSCQLRRFRQHPTKVTGVLHIACIALLCWPLCTHLRACAQVQKARAENVPIRIQLPEGSAKEGVRGVTTPQDILQQLPRSVAKKAVVAKVDGQVWDMSVPLEGDCNLQILTFEDPEGKEVPPIV